MTKQLVVGKEYLRFCLTGAFNVTTFFCLYEGLYFLFSDLEHKAAVAWIFSYITTSFVAYATHKKWTFDSDVSWETSLPWSIGIYGSTLIMSTFSEVMLIEFAEIHHRIAWLINCSCFGLLNYLGLRHVAFVEEEE